MTDTTIGTGPATGWYSDPTGRADQRRWDGSRWTTETRDAPHRSFDDATAPSIPPVTRRVATVPAVFVPAVLPAPTRGSRVLPASPASVPIAPLVVARRPLDPVAGAAASLSSDVASEWLANCPLAHRESTVVRAQPRASSSPVPRRSAASRAASRRRRRTGVAITLCSVAAVGAAAFFGLHAAGLVGPGPAPVSAAAPSAIAGGATQSAPTAGVPQTGPSGPGYAYSRPVAQASISGLVAHQVGTAPSSVACPADEPLAVTTSFTCSVLLAGGAPVTAHVTIVDTTGRMLVDVS